MRDVSVSLGLAVVRRVDAEIVRRITWVHASVACKGVGVARLRADDVQVRLERDWPRDPVARERIADVVRAQRVEHRVEVGRDGRALGVEGDDVVPVELDEPRDGERERARERRGGAQRGGKGTCDQQRKERQDERQVARLVLQPRVRRDEVEDREDRDDQEQRREPRRPSHEQPDEAGGERRVDQIPDDGAAEPLERPGEPQAERLRQRRDDEVVHVRRPGALVLPGVERVPVVAQVAEQPRQSADDRGGDDERHSAQHLAPAPDEPAERRQRDDRDLRARPEAAAEGEPEQHEIAARHALGEAQDEQQDREAEEELGSVEAVRAGRLPVEVRGPDPEQHRGQYGSLLVEHPQADPPDEDCRHGPEGDDDEPNRPGMEPEPGDERRREERLLRAAVALPGKKTGRVPCRIPRAIRPTTASSASSAPCGRSTAQMRSAMPAAAPPTAMRSSVRLVIGRSCGRA